MLQSCYVGQGFKKTLLDYFIHSALVVFTNILNCSSIMHECNGLGTTYPWRNRCSVTMKTFDEYERS